MKAINLYYQGKKNSFYRHSPQEQKSPYDSPQRGIENT